MSAEKTIKTLWTEISGRYEHDTGTLHIEQIDGQSARFDILVATASECTGEIGGDLVFQDLRHATYSDGPCRLRFVFGRNQVESWKNTVVSVMDWRAHLAADIRRYTKRE